MQKIAKQAAGILAVLVLFCSCGAGHAFTAQSIAAPPAKILIAAAASLEAVLREELIPLFTQTHGGIVVEGVYDSSGKLQTQIQEGLGADVFISAATKQMNALVAEGMIDGERVVPLLENELVLIASVQTETTIDSFREITQAESVALGDPASVPAGQYAQEALVYLGLWDVVLAKASFASSVTEVLGWVREGSAEVGIVYATDAAQASEVRVLAGAPAGSLAEGIVYPAGIVAGTRNVAAAALFLTFLQSEEALAIFTAHGFTPIGS